ncbi:MAG: Hint domain-containing protein [Brevirhabdus sp.]
MARISELHYSNAYAASSGVSEFLEVSLSAGEDPADFSVSFYEANGSLGVTINLNDPGVQASYDPDSNEYVYVISADYFNILLTDPNGGGSGNYEAYALVDTSSSTVVDFYDIGGGTQNITATNGPAAGATSVNLPVLTGPNSTTTTLQFNQPDPDVLTYGTVDPGSSGVICFARGTLMLTPDGEVPVEKLKTGDMLETADHGARPIRWIGKRTVRADGELAPIVFRQGALGNRNVLVVSPQHRMLVAGAETEMLFGEEEVLVAAKHLVNGDTIFVRPGGLVTYYHVMLDAHELVFSNGVLSESFYVSKNSLATLDAAARTELLTLFPHFAAENAEDWVTARTTLKGHEARTLALAA